MAKNVLIVIGLLALGVLVFCLCCYKVTNLLYQLFTIDSADHAEMVSPTAFSRQEKKLSPPPPPVPLQLNSNEKSSPPDCLTPRCSRHSGLRSSKEELAMVNINNFPSVGDLSRQSDRLGHRASYNSVERLLPPYPSYSNTNQYHRKTNGAVGTRRTEDNPSPSYSYSYTNINCGQDPPTSSHQPLPHNFHHIATLRRTPVSSHQDQSRWCSSGVSQESPQHHHHLPPSSRLSHSSYVGPGCGGPLAGGSRESLEDREVRAMFHRDTLLARIVRL